LVRRGLWIREQFQHIGRLIFYDVVDTAIQRRFYVPWFADPLTMLDPESFCQFDKIKIRILDFQVPRIRSNRLPIIVLRFALRLNYRPEPLDESAVFQVVHDDMQDRKIMMRPRPPHLGILPVKAVG
jgi:hypothetical protein